MKLMRLETFQSNLCQLLTSVLIKILILCLLGVRIDIFLVCLPSVRCKIIHADHAIWKMFGRHSEWGLKLLVHTFRKIQLQTFATTFATTYPHCALLVKCCMMQKWALASGPVILHTSHNDTWEYSNININILMTLLTGYLWTFYEY